MERLETSNSGLLKRLLLIIITNYYYFSNSYITGLGVKCYAYLHLTVLLHLSFHKHHLPSIEYQHCRVLKQNVAVLN